MKVGSNLGLRPVTVRKEFLLIVKQFLARFSGELLVLS